MNDIPEHNPDLGDEELGLAIDPAALSSPGSGDLAPEPTDSASAEVNFFYTQGGTPC
ncbi:hypothetical protein ACQEVB_18840 [Pseudonocardia sp. CA-107938]|uniref:hypothetical protein n=1 Tax=Pseudonocardia sp. CA-107938 TaxID=3240021 RepID=UPI003D8B289E